jgi:hypothetical protein
VIGDCEHTSLDVLERMQRFHSASVPQAWDLQP